MKNLKVAVLSLIVFGVVSCIDAAPRDAAPRDTRPKIPWSQEVINSWIGASVTKMIKSGDWGAPTKTYTISGKEYVVYVREGSYSHPGGRFSSGYSSSYVGCTWTWEIRNGRIVGGSAAGGRCNDKNF